jgi:PAS domain S-box-containing protein
VRTPFRAYALSMAVLVAAVALRLLLDPVMGDRLQLVTLFGAVAAAVWMGGYRPAAVVVLLGYLACHVLFIPPRGRFSFAETGTVVGLVAYLFTCSLIIGIGQAMRTAQARASQRGELLRVTLASIGDAVITTDVDGRITYLNAVAESLTGWTQREAAGQPLDAVFRIVNEDTRKPVENPAARALKDGVVVGLANHTVLLPREGGERPIDDSAAPIKDGDGNVSGCVLIFRDVTAERRSAQNKSRQLSDARLLAAIVESSDDGIVSKSLEGRILTWNAGAERLFGYTATEAIGRHISLVIPPDRIAEEDTIIASLKAGRRIDHFVTERVRRDGNRMWVSLTISPIKDDDGHVVGASKIVRDVTRQRQVEADRQKFVTLVETSTDFIGICDLEGVPFFVNRAGLEMVGLADLDEARGKPMASFFFPEDQDRITNEFLPSVLKNGHGEIEIRFRHFKTGEARWMAYKVLALPDADGRPVAYATVSQDVTERKRLADDLRTLAADLSEANRRKTEFLAMLAHELRNPLAPISNAVRAMRLRAGAGPPSDQAYQMLERQIGQLVRLVDDLLDMSRISRGKIELRKQDLELGPVVEQAVEATRALYGNLNQELTIAMPPRPVYLSGDPARLAQIVGNLLNNACKFTDRGGHVALTVAQEAGQAIIRVRDDGIGIATEQMPMLFEMFMQADTSPHRAQAGLGIGLTLVKRLVELHGGTITARSEGLGRGSEFEVRLPMLSEAPRPQAPAAVEAPAPQTPRRILIVDDNEDGAESLAMLLEAGGHETHQVHDGFAAIAAGERLRPDLVLLDIGLPRMNGYEVCRRIRQQPWGRDLMLVALTGWGQEEDRQRSKEAGFDAHLVKPVDFDLLDRLLAADVAAG